MANKQLDELVEQIKASKKYRMIASEYIRRIGARELAHQSNLKAAVKSTKNKLHQTANAYLNTQINYERLRQSFHAEADLKTVCRDAMRLHLSTSERLPILDTFYATVLAEVGTINSVLDLACGLNPLAIPWMPLAAGCQYLACDIFEDMIDFHNWFIPFVNLTGHAELVDLGGRVPTDEVDLALLLKAIPCLEQTDKSQSLELLKTIRSNYILVTFPLQTIGGRRVGMETMYQQQMNALITDEPWQVKHFVFSTELAFLIQKDKK